MLSDFEKMVLDALVLEDPEKEAIMAQLQDATVLERHHTAVGLFTEIRPAANSPSVRKTDRFSDDMANLQLEHPEVPAGAGAILWFEGGKVSTLECYTFDGDWPENEALFTVRAK